MDSHSQAQVHKVITNFLLSQTTHRPETNDTSSPPPAYSFQQEQHDSEQDEEEESTLSPITIHISTPLTITGTSNLILLPPTTTTATTIALEVLRALKTATIGEVGIPMIDEDGRPRPLDVKIDAGVRIEGRGNVVGEKGALEGLRKIIREKAGGRDRNDLVRGRGMMTGDSRKRRASSAPADEREGKRERMA